MADRVQCPECLKLFEADGQALCSACRSKLLSTRERVREAIRVHDKLTPVEVAMFLGIPLEDAEAMFTALEEEAVASGRRVVCQRCKRRPATDESRFCLECWEEIEQGLRDAAERLERTIEARTEQDPSLGKERPTGLRNAMERRRRWQTDQGPRPRAK